LDLMNQNNCFCLGFVSFVLFVSSWQKNKLNVLE
jgi:hypothetical protein